MEQSSNQSSVRAHGIPLSLYINFKFHFLLENNEYRTTTLGQDPLQFITAGQKVIEANGRRFQHPLITTIWNIAVGCKRLGDGNMITVLVPVNNETRDFDWETKNLTKESANLWVRVVEIDSTHIGETKAVEDARSICEYLEGVQRVVWSESVATGSYSLSFKEAVKGELAKAKENFVEARVTWFKTIGIEG
ncbi:hypothetical protein BGZ60DRAFT_513827 [Tricladium varicosporioides]|nr:hypothetical protein BGZ60DRAFT_513827 [Hymenoscyphus varicosporioides]